MAGPRTVLPIACFFTAGLVPVTQATVEQHAPENLVLKTGRRFHEMEARDHSEAARGRESNLPGVVLTAQLPGRFEYREAAR